MKNRITIVKTKDMVNIDSENIAFLKIKEGSGIQLNFSDKERKIKPYFDKLQVSYINDDLRVVEYCYYNGSDPMDCYDINNSDDSKLFIS